MTGIEAISPRGLQARLYVLSLRHCVACHKFTIWTKWQLINLVHLGYLCPLEVTSPFKIFLSEWATPLEARPVR